MPFFPPLIVTGSIGSSTSPGGSNQSVQFNNAGVFGGGTDLTWNSASKTLTVANTIASNTITEMTLNAGVTVGGVNLTNGVVAYSGVRGIRESGGTPLGFGLIGNNQYLYRSGNYIIGIAGSIGSGSGGGTPGGLDTYVQFNNAGSFGATSAFTFNTSTNTVTVNGEIYIEGEVGQSATTPYFRVRDSSSNELFKIQGDGVLHNLRGNVVPIYRDNSLNNDLNINSTTSADRTYLFLNPISGDRNVIVKSNPENGRSYVVNNIGTGYLLNIRNANTGFIIASIAPYFSTMVVYDGINWVNLS